MSYRETICFFAPLRVGAYRKLVMNDWLRSELFEIYLTEHRN